MQTPSASFYYHRDGLGSIVNLTSSVGIPQWAYSYEPFGATRSEQRLDPAAPENSIRFAGEYLDTDTGLYHLRARQYDPALGRFLSTDPLAPAKTDSYVASYIYANNRPTTLIDPSGLASEAGDDSCNSFWSFSCIKDWFLEDQIGWRDGCAYSTRCILQAEVNVALAVIPWGRGAKAAQMAIPDVVNLTAKIRRQMPTRGWTESDLAAAFRRGEAHAAINKATGGQATRYVHPDTGASMVVDDTTGAILHIGKPGFRY